MPAVHAQRVLITGANRGIGLEFVRQLLARGDRVIAACRNPGRALKLTELAGAYPGRLHVLPLDIDKERSIAGFARETGMLGETLDVLINCAGVLVSGERFGELVAKTFDETLHTNAVGPLLLTQALAPLLARSSRARVVNVSSDLGSLADTVHFHTPSYAVSKAALNMVTRLTAAELAPRGIVVVSLHPGWVRTDMGGPGASLSVEESTRGIVDVLEARAGTSHHGFVDYRGREVAW